MGGKVVTIAERQGAMPLAEDERERLTRAETQLGTIGASMAEIKGLIVDLGRRLEVGYVPRAELDQRFANLESRLVTVEQRPMGIPPWVAIVGSFLIGLVSLLGGTLIGLVINGQK